MQHYEVYLTDEMLTTSVINMLNMNSDIWVGNPYYKADKGLFIGTPFDENRYLTTARNGKKYLNGPRIYVKETINNKVFFTNAFSLVWATGKGVPKKFRILAPYNYQSTKGSQVQSYSLKISPEKGEKIDELLALLYWKLAMIEDLLLIAKIFNINIKQIETEDNKQFYKNFCEEIKKHTDGIIDIELSDDYIMSFNEAPIFDVNYESSNSEKCVPTTENKTVIETLYKKVVKEISNKLKQGFKLPREYTNIFGMKIFPLIYSIPKFKKCKYHNRNTNTDEHSYDIAITMYLKNANKFRETYFRENKTSIHEMDDKMFESLFYNGPNTNHRLNLGVIYISPSYYYTISGTGHMTVNANADVVYLKPVQTQINTSTLGLDFVIDDEVTDESDIVHPKTWSDEENM